MRLIAAAFFALLLCSSGGCTSEQSPTNTPASTSTTTLIYSRGEDANTLDPIHTDIGETVKVIVNLYDTLVAYHDEQAELVPALAESWEASADGKTWKFQLRKGVVFHDGTPFNSAAVVFSLQRLIDKEHPHVYDSAVPYRPSYQMIERMETPSDHEVVFHLRDSSAVFLQNMAMFPASIVSPTAVMKQGKAYGEHPAGTGPFRLAKWNRDQQLVLEKFPEHWRGAPSLNNVVFLPIHDSATRIQQIRRGEAQIADDLPAAELEILAKEPGLVVQERAGFNVAYLTFQTEKPPLNRTDVRLAIAQAINKQRFIELQYQGHAQPAKTVVPPGMFAHAEALVDHAYDVEAAKQLLKQAASEGNFELPLSLTLNVMNQSRPYLPEPENAAAFIKDSLAAIGINVTIHQQDVNQHFPYLMAGKHQLALAGWTSDNSDPDNFLYSLLDSDNIGEHGNNLSRFRDARFHELLLQGQKEIDSAKRLPLYLEAQAIVLRESPVIPLAHSSMRVAQRANVKDYHLHPTGLVRLRNVRLEAAK
jgi:peptide/nickel transport system substrate-binding protein